MVRQKFPEVILIEKIDRLGGLGDLNYPLISDIKKEISAAYNVLDPGS